MAVGGREPVAPFRRQLPQSVPASPQVVCRFSRSHAGSSQHGSCDATGGSWSLTNLLGNSLSPCLCRFKLLAMILHHSNGASRLERKHHSISTFVCRATSGQGATTDRSWCLSRPNLTDDARRIPNFSGRSSLALCRRDTHGPSIIVSAGSRAASGANCHFRTGPTDSGQLGPPSHGRVNHERRSCYELIFSSIHRENRSAGLSNYCGRSTQLWYLIGDI